MKLSFIRAIAKSLLLFTLSIAVWASPTVARAGFWTGDDLRGRGGINCTGILSGRTTEEPQLMPGLDDDEDSLLGLSGVNVHVYQLVSKTSSTVCVYSASSSSQCWVEDANVSVDLAGYYVVTGLPLTTSSLLGVATGTFKVRFEPTDGCHVGEFYNDQATFDAATTVTLTSLVSSLVLDTAELAVSGSCRVQE